MRNREEAIDFLRQAFGIRHIFQETGLRQSGVDKRQLLESVDGDVGKLCDVVWIARAHRLKQ